MDTVRRDIANAARTNAKVLITGETGVGKEIVARRIHGEGMRRQRPFVPVNCSGIPETLLASELFGHTRGSFTSAYTDRLGLVQRADHGTLFLDELGEMSLQMQAMLLRFTETGEIQRVGADTPTGRTDVRLITATNRDLRAQIAAGAFREDLYYRLNVIHIVIPPLRARGADIGLLLRHYLRQASLAHQLPCPELMPEAEALLLRYQWPGNVRELRNISERLTLRASTEAVRVDELPAEVRMQDGQAPATDHARGSSSAPLDTAVEQMWAQLRTGADFWTVVQRPFRRHRITTTELSALIDRGLQETRGSYRALVGLFNMAPGDYKRFHAFLYQQNCNLPVGPYRRDAMRRPPPARVRVRDAGRDTATL